jgi:hypothetical protein
MWIQAAHRLRGGGDRRRSWAAERRSTRFLFAAQTDEPIVAGHLDEFSPAGLVCLQEQFESLTQAGYDVELIWCRCFDPRRWSR